LTIPITSRRRRRPADAGADRRAARRGVRGGDVGVDAVVDVDRGPLCALEQDLLAGVETLPEKLPAVDRHPLAVEALAERPIPFEERVDVEGVAVDVAADLQPVDLLDERSLAWNDVLEPRAERLGVEQIPDPDAPATGLVLVCRADPATGCPGFEVVVGFGVLLDSVEHPVVREDRVCAFGDADVRGKPAFGQRVDLLEQRVGVDDAAVSEDPDLSADGARGNERELVLVALVDDGVAGVVAALVAHDDVDGIAVHVDDAAFAFVAELRTHDGYGHRNGRSSQRGKQITVSTAFPAVTHNAGRYGARGPLGALHGPIPTDGNRRRLYISARRTRRR